MTKTPPRLLVPPGHTTTGHDSAVTVRFVQDRLALFAKVVFFFALVYIVMGAIVALTGAVPFFTPGRESHLLAATIDA